MGKRGNGEGSITRRKDGRWEARYYVPTVNGTKRKTLYGRTQAGVRVKLTKALSDRIDGIRATGVEAVARGEGPGRSHARYAG
jgi:integrase